MKGFKITDTFIPGGRVSSAFTSICKTTRLWRDVEAGPSSQERRPFSSSPHGLKATPAAIYSYVGLPSGVSVAPRENLRATGWWGFLACPNPLSNIFTKTPRNSGRSRPVPCGISVSGTSRGCPRNGAITPVILFCVITRHCMFVTYTDNTTVILESRNSDCCVWLLTSKKCAIF